MSSATSLSLTRHEANVWQLSSNVTGDSCRFYDRILKWNYQLCYRLPPPLSPHMAASCYTVLFPSPWICGWWSAYTAPSAACIWRLSGPVVGPARHHVGWWKDRVAVCHHSYWATSGSVLRLLYCDEIGSLVSSKVALHSLIVRQLIILVDGDSRYDGRSVGWSGRSHRHLLWKKKYHWLSASRYSCKTAQSRKESTCMCLRNVYYTRTPI